MLNFTFLNKTSILNLFMQSSISKNHNSHIKKFFLTKKSTKNNKSKIDERVIYILGYYFDSIIKQTIFYFR